LQGLLACGVCGSRMANFAASAVTESQSPAS